MKKMTLLMFAAAGFLSLAACSDDDSNDDKAENAKIAGTYILTSWNAPVAVDFDGDGDSHTNLMDESTCYHESKIVFNADGTYTLTYDTLGVNDGAGICRSDVSTGTWTRNVHTITTSTVIEGSTITNDYTFTDGDKNTLTRTLSNVHYPMINAAGEAAYGVGDVNYVFTEQN